MKPDGKAEPRFDIDLPYGRQAELQLADYLSWLAEGNGRIEVKRKRRLDLWFYVETHCDKGRRGVYAPSGISTTGAAAWAFTIADTNISIILPTEDLRAALIDPSTRDCEENDGSCPTRGRLVSLNVLLYRHQRRQQQVAPAPPRPVEPARPLPMLTAADIPFRS
jgi:hypothetical protein